MSFQKQPGGSQGAGVPSSITAVIQGRADLRRSSIKAVMAMAGDSLTDDDDILASIVHKKPVVVSMQDRLKEHYPAHPEDPYEVARHFNTIFKPLLQIRKTIDYDEEAAVGGGRPIESGDLHAILGCIIHVFRKLRSMPQLRMLSAMKRFFRAVGVISRLIRCRNEARRTMLLDIVKWWDDEEARYRQKLDEDMQSWLFKFHHELSEVIEQKVSLSIPPEVKFGVVQMLFYKQRQKSSKIREAWRKPMRRITDALEELKASASRGPSGKYMEPTESHVRLQRRKFWDLCDKRPVVTHFDKECVTYDRLMEVRNEIVRLKSQENRKRLLSEFHLAVEQNRDKRRASHLAMEARREDNYKRRQAERRERQKQFEVVQQQRHDIMSGNSSRRGSRRRSNAASGGGGGSDGETTSPPTSAAARRSSSVSFVAQPATAGVAAPPSAILNVAPKPNDNDVNDGEDAVLLNLEHSSATAATAADDSMMRGVMLPSESPPMSPGGGQRRGRVASVVVFSRSSFSAPVNDDVPISSPIHFHGAPANVSGISDPSAIMSGGGATGGSLVRSSSSSLMGSGLGGLARSRSSSMIRSSSFSKLVSVDLGQEMEADPLAFLQKFGTKQYEEVLRSKEAAFRLQLEQSHLDEDRKIVQQIVFRNRLRPTPQLQSFFEAAAAPVRDETTVPWDANSSTTSSLLEDTAVPLQSAQQTTVTEKRHLAPIRADDPSIRVHVPVISAVRVRQPPAPRHQRRQPPLEMGTAMRPMTPGLADVISPWQRLGARPDVQWPLWNPQLNNQRRAQTPPPAAAPAHSPLAAVGPLALHTITAQASMGRGGSLAPKSAQFQAVKEKAEKLTLRTQDRCGSPPRSRKEKVSSSDKSGMKSPDGSDASRPCVADRLKSDASAAAVDLSGLRQDPVEALLHPPQLTAVTAAEVVTRQKQEAHGQRISVLPPQHRPAPQELAGTVASSPAPRPSPAQTLGATWSVNQTKKQRAGGGPEWSAAPHPSLRASFSPGKAANATLHAYRSTLSAIMDSAMGL